MQIIVSIRHVYGNETIYPVCPKAKTLAALAGTKTLTRTALAHIRALGFEITLQPVTL